MPGSGDVRRVTAKRYWREEDARVVVEAWRESGMTRAAFARRHGVDLQRLARWSARLGEAAGPSVRFHPVRLAMTESPHVGGIELQLGAGRRIRLEHGFDVEDLRRVLELLGESVSC